MEKDPAPNPEERPLAQRLLWEGPWILWGAVAGGVLVSRSRAVPYPTSGGWMEYLQFVELFRDPDRVVQLNDWRKPTWGLLVAGWAELTGRSSAQAAFDAAGVSVVLTVLAAALLGRVLGGRTAAALTVLSALWLAPLQDSALWLSSYPVEGAAVGLGLALAAAGARWGRLVFLFPGVFLSGLAYAIDGRGGLAMVSTLGLALVAAVRAGGGRRWWIPPAALGLALLPALAERWLSHAWHIPQTPILDQVLTQHAHSLPLPWSPASDAPRPPTASLLGDLVRSASSPGGVELLARNTSTYLPGWAQGLGVALLLLLVPARRARACPAVIPALLYLPFIMGWTVYASLVGIFPRYTTIFWALLLALAPSAAQRTGLLVGARWPHRRRVAGGLALAGALAWLVVAWPGLRGPLPRVETRPHTVDAPRAFAVAARISALATRGDTVVDCQNRALGPLLPPRLRYVRRELGPGSGLPERRTKRCAAEVADPPAPGTSWLLLGPEKLDEAVLQEHGWQRVSLDPDTAGEYSVWVRRGARRSGSDGGG